MIEYRLVVGVLGIIFDEDSASEAKRQFDLFVTQSKSARLEDRVLVTLFKNHEIIAEYYPDETGDSNSISSGRSGHHCH
jgi:hypothetical protein